MKKDNDEMNISAIYPVIGIFAILVLILVSMYIWYLEVILWRFYTYSNGESMILYQS